MKIKITVLFAFFHSMVFSQNIIECNAKKSYWVIKNNKDSIAIELLGKVQKTENPNLIALNNLPLQILLVDKKAYVTEENKNDQFEILQAHADSEQEYLSKVFETELDAKKFKVELKDNMTTLFWFYKMPESANKEVSAQLFVSIILDDKIFGLSTSQFKGQDFEKLQYLLMDTLYSMKKIESEKNLCD